MLNPLKWFQRRQVQRKFLKEDTPPPRHFDTTVEADVHAMFVLMIVNLGYVYNVETLRSQFGHDLRSGALSKVVDEGLIWINPDGSLELTSFGQKKLLAMKEAGLLCKGKPAA